MIDVQQTESIALIRGPNAREWLRPFFDSVFSPAKLAKDGGQFRKLYVRAINRFEKCLGQSARLGDLTGPKLATFREWLASENYGTRSCETSPKLVRAIWKHAATIGRLRKHPPDRRKPYADEWAKAAKQKGAVKSLRQLAVRQSLHRLTNQINRLHDFIGHEPMPAEVTRELLGQYSEWLVGQGFAQASARNYAGQLWRLAHPAMPAKKPEQGSKALDPSTPLADLLSRYTVGRDIERDSLKPLHAGVQCFSHHLGRPASLVDLTADAVNDWLAAEIDRWSRRTAKNKRASVLTLWRWAFDERLWDNPPIRVRLIRAPLPPVAAYTKEEVQRLVKACDVLDRTEKFSRARVLRKFIHRALLMVTYDTGFRPGDVLRLRWDNVAENGCVQIVQHKTGYPVTRWLHESTMIALARIRLKDEPRIFRCHLSMETWRSAFRQLKTEAGITRGTMKWIRRAAATQIAIAHGESAASHALGHKTADMARKHYIDNSQITVGQVMTPVLDLG